MLRLIALFDVAVIAALFLAARIGLRETEFSDWQEPLFGGSHVTRILLFFVLPLIFLAIRRREPGYAGLTGEHLGFHLFAGFWAAAFIAPATFLFPVVAGLGFDPNDWAGAIMLSAGFLSAGLLFAMTSRKVERRRENNLSWAGLSFYIVVLALGLVACYYLNPVAPIIARIVGVVLFIGFMEEFFFRGYIQSRINDAFGRPWRFLNVEFGFGLFVAAALFGLFHPLTAMSADGAPWPWGLWTAVTGLVFGFLREKTGSAIAPAVLHGIILIPSVLFA